MQTRQTTQLHRWLRFNAVGLLGAVVQLATLAFLNHAARGHYLLHAAAAVELTLLHNFVWHIHYTWPTRRGLATRLRQGARFQLANGAISLLGNLALMRLLVGGAHLSPTLANLVAILLCSALNFLVGSTWIFA